MFCFVVVDLLKHLKLETMTIEQLDQIYNEALEKPRSFHYVCYGGGTVKMVDAHWDLPIYKCRFQGDENWITPMCKNCKGLIGEYMELTEYQSTFNYGIKRLYGAIRKALINNKIKL